MRLGCIALALAACGAPRDAAPVGPANVPPPTTTSTPTVDAAPASDEERLAAIQLAMNELDEAAQGCWAAAATDRFDIEGDVAVTVDITASGATASIARDTTRNTKLTACLVQLLGAYRWAPPLHGQAIQLPFQFRAPAGQNVIDRRLVSAKQQGKIAVSVLLDESNTGNDAASLLEVAIAEGGTTGVRAAERAELWMFLGPADVSFGHARTGGGTGRAGQTVAAGDMMFVPPGAVREVEGHKGQAARAVVVLVPGGREGVARAGALPARDHTVTTSKPALPKLLLARDAKTYGPATIYLEKAALSASLLRLGADAKVPEHVHAGETEVLYILDGSGTMTVDGVAVAITPTSVVQIPANTKHAFTATSAVRALQIYTPAGPEQRFKVKP